MVPQDLRPKIIETDCSFVLLPERGQRVLYGHLLLRENLHDLLEKFLPHPAFIAVEWRCISQAISQEVAV